MRLAEGLLEDFTIFQMEYGHSKGMFSEKDLRLCETCMARILYIRYSASTGGSVVEFSPATRETRLRIPASAVRLANHFARFFYQLLSGD